jgi:hypothetical protein
MQIRRNLTFTMLALSLLGVIIAVVAREQISDFFRPRPASPRPPQIKLPPSPEEFAKPHLSWAEQECERVIDEHVKALDTFFTDSKKNTRPFAGDALSWGSKWRLVIDHVPYTSGGRHEKYVRERFEEYVFTPSQLEDAVKQVVSSYLAHVCSIEGKMLVNLRADVAEFPTAYPIGQLDETKLRATYDEALQQAIDATGKDLQANIGTELVSIITGEVLTQVALRLGVSAGILGTGAASSWATLGIGVVVGLIVDQIVSWVWDWWADPKGNLAAQLDTKLDEINRLIVDGSDNVQGLRAQLRQFGKERSVARSKAVLSVLQSQTGGAQ